MSLRRETLHSRSPGLANVPVRSERMRDRRSEVWGPKPESEWVGDLGEATEIEEPRLPLL